VGESSAPGSAKAPTARQRRRDRLQPAPGRGLPANVLAASIIDMRDRGAATAAIAVRLDMAPKAVRKVLMRCRQRRASISKPVERRT
jgi:hypothetical protein